MERKAIVDLLAREKMINVQVVRMCAAMQVNSNVTRMQILWRQLLMGKMEHVSQYVSKELKYAIKVMSAVILNTAVEKRMAQ